MKQTPYRPTYAPSSKTKAPSAFIKIRRSNYRQYVASLSRTLNLYISYVKKHIDLVVDGEDLERVDEVSKLEAKLLVKTALMIKDNLDEIPLQVLEYCYSMSNVDNEPKSIADIKKIIEIFSDICVESSEYNKQDIRFLSAKEITERARTECGNFDLSSSRIRTISDIVEEIQEGLGEGEYRHK